MSLFSLTAQKVSFAYPELKGELLNGGDDYELLFTISPEYKTNLLKDLIEIKTQLSEIGTLTMGIIYQSLITSPTKKLFSYF